MTALHMTEQHPPVTTTVESPIREAWLLFELGDNRGARRAATQALQGAESDPARAEAADLLRRIGFDPLAAIAAGVIATVITVVVILLAVSHRFSS
jgi:hypothetical protein